MAEKGFTGMRNRSSWGGADTPAAPIKALQMGQV